MAGSVIEKQKIRRIIEKYIEEGGSFLSEYDSLRLISSLGLPVVRYEYASSAPEARKIAFSFNYPAVIKGVVEAAAHKTEKGLVHLWIRNRESAESVIKELEPICSGFLFEEQVDGVRELQIGAVRDDTFGPVVMVGFGGVHSELINDIVFVMAPVVEKEVREALSFLKSSRMLADYRGQMSCKVDELIRIIKGVGWLISEIGEIREMDLNPVIIGKGGAPVVSSGLIVI